MIHPTAIVHPKARLADGVHVGAFTIIDQDVEVGADTHVGHHCVITGHTRIGAGNRIAHFVSLGEAPQDKKYRGEPTRLEIGDRNTIREFCTFNRGTAQDRGVTLLGDDNWIMAYVHLAHDCRIGDHTIFANNAQLAGHVEVGDHAILGGFTVVHQFCRIGRHALTAMGTIVLQDVPPFVTVSGNPAAPHGINSEGLRRRGFDAHRIEGLRRAYRTLYRSGLSLAEARQSFVAQRSELPDLDELLAFIDGAGRGLVR